MLSGLDIGLLKYYFMNIRLHEIEFGCADAKKTGEFYQAALGLSIQVDQPGLKVFNAGINGLDLNASIHLPSGNTMISFITDNLEEVMDKLMSLNILYDGPRDTHLGMLSISFNDPDGNLIKVNCPGEHSPEWLKQ